MFVSEQFISESKKEQLYSMNIIKGSLLNARILNKFKPVIIEKWDDEPEWIALIRITCTLNDANHIKKQMVKHYENDKIPWYMDGWELNNMNERVVIFGYDDGSRGKVFLFNVKDKRNYNACIKYGLSKGIPKEQLDFLESYK